MAVVSSGVGNYLSRSAPWLNINEDWTIAGWVYFPTVTGSNSATAYIYGDGTFVTPYIWIGCGALNASIEVFDGVTYTDINISVLQNTWVYLAARYNSTTHELSFRMNQTDGTAEIVDLSLISFGSTTEWATMDIGSTTPVGTGLAYWGEWQIQLTDDQLYDQSRTTGPNTATGTILVFTPLPTASILIDTAGNSRDWIATGTITTLVSPRLGIFDDQFIMTQIQNTMIEPDDGGQTWPSELWTMDEVVSYLNQRQNRFLKNTHFQFGISNIDATAGTRTYDLPDDWVNTVRVLWVRADGSTKELTRSDLWEADNGIPTWSYVNAEPILFYDGGRPITIQLAPVPDEDATLLIHYVPYAALLSGNGDIMTLPDEFVVPLKYGAMADMLTKVSRVQDVRAQYCESRYAMGVEIAKLLLGGFK